MLGYTRPLAEWSSVFQGSTKPTKKEKSQAIVMATIEAYVGTLIEWALQIKTAISLFWWFGDHSLGGLQCFKGVTKPSTKEDYCAYTSCHSAIQFQG
jgi:hypothetical protein